MEGDHRREVVFGMVVHVPHHGFPLDPCDPTRDDLTRQTAAASARRVLGEQGRDSFIKALEKGGVLQGKFTD